MNLASRRSTRVLKTLLFFIGLIPFTILVAEALGLFDLNLGANPVEEILHRFGKWGLNFLLITLCVTPLQRLTRWNWLIRYRRMLGLFVFFYISMHFLTYALLDQRLDLSAVGEDIVERPYITLGMTGLLLLIPLAVTSTNKMMRRLGSRWKKLHRLIYVIAILGVWHFFWQVKKDIQEPAIYAGILAVLLLVRIWWRFNPLKKRI